MSEKKKLPLWIDKGLSFKCTGCGKCCTGSPGYVWLTQADIKQLTEHLDISKEEFLQNYCKQVGRRYSLVDLPPHYDCIFLHENKCLVYEARPKQCRKFPWWVENLKTEEAWKEAAKSCEGINHPDAELIPKEVIEEELNS